MVLQFCGERMGLRMCQAPIIVQVHPSWGTQQGGPVQRALAPQRMRPAPQHRAAQGACPCSIMAVTWRIDIRFNAFRMQCRMRNIRVSVFLPISTAMCLMHAGGVPYTSPLGNCHGICRWRRPGTVGANAPHSRREHDSQLPDGCFHRSDTFDMLIDAHLMAGSTCVVLRHSQLDPALLPSNFVQNDAVLSAVLRNQLLLMEECVLQRGLPEGDARWLFQQIALAVGMHPPRSMTNCLST